MKGVLGAGTGQGEGGQDSYALRASSQNRGWRSEVKVEVRGL